MSRYLLPLIVLLSACSIAAPELTADERAAGAAALAGWRAAGLPEPNQDKCVVEQFYIRLDDVDSFAFDCRSTPEAAAGCLNWTSSNHFFRPFIYPVVVISPNWRSEPSIIVHELMHAMTHCSHLDGEWTPLNFDHKDPRVWSAAGGVTSAQSRAMALLTGQP